ncbi:CHAT domain-containing protein [Aureispira anguillae]|uniref:CHAT domain-containing protein n=1 Tax=Aureispira anguillae TaxID=2864201 RepID=A0A915YHU6_9BACT|nr:CHAT domain-containing protein [Aureispira anguillae]BDS13460.1 CHAT domain-containing protein [Aureispira anguillae]
MKYYSLILYFLMLNFFVNGQIPELASPDAAYQLLQKGETFYLKGEYQNAIPLLEQATALYADNYDGKLLASSLHSLAWLHLGQKDQAYTTFVQAGELMAGGKVKSPAAFVAYDLCVSRYYWAYYEPDKALELSQRIEKKLKTIKPDFPTSIAIELSEYLGVIKISKGNYEAAIPYYKAAIAKIEKLPAAARNKQLFKFNYFKLGELYEKIKAPYDALEIYKTLQNRKDEIFQNTKEDNIELLYRIGMIKMTTQYYDEALAYLKDVADKINQSGKKGQLKASINASLAKISIDQKNYEKGIQWNTAALKTWNSFLPPNDLAYAYTAYLNQGLLYRSVKNGLNWYETAASETDKNWQVALRKRGLTPIQSSKQEVDVLALNLGLLAYEKAGALIGRFPKAKQMPLKIETHIAKGDLFFIAEDFSRARTYYQEALSAMKSIYPQKHPWIAEVASKLGQCLLAEKQYNEALNLVNEAIAATLKEGTEISRQAVPDPSKIYYPFELLNAISTKGEILYGMSQKEVKEDLEKVLDNYDIAVQLLNRLRKIHRNEGEKYELSALTHQFCQQAVVTANTLYELTKDAAFLEEIFRYGELSKGAVLLETLQDLKAKKIAKIPQELIQKEHQLKVELAYLNKEIFYTYKDTSKLSAKRIGQLEKEVEDRMKAHELLLQQLEKEYPDYYKMKYDYKTVTLADLQRELADNEAFLEYVVSDSFVFVLAITNHTVYNQYKKTGVSTAKYVRDLLRYIRTQKAEKYVNLGHKVYEVVMGEELDKKLEGKKLIIAPDETLNYLPFGVLPTTSDFKQGDQELIYGKLTYLINSHPITYNYSANLFLQSKQEKTTEVMHNIIAWAPSFSSMQAILKEKNIADGIEELPAAQEEANLIARLFDGQTALAETATEYEFKQNASNFGVLHLATHGVLNDRNPSFSSLILNQGNKEDGLLHTYELFNMQLNADMAVLSACNSGVGVLKRGEGVVSIARGFAYAGVPNIVMSTWAVSDEATKILMETFYQALQQGMPKDEALQQAKIAYLKEFESVPRYQAPFFWGSFVVLGNTDPVAILIEYSLWDYWWCLALLLLLLLLGFGYKTIKKKRVAAK